ncbi:MAG: prepilin-type N-terminal cleavage/methylation domain-containing protein [Candidatus Falkowbacteria bacterium]|nr:prepilin-type N-terminal cleavage/methylation domain-containing protein [Candidatus Falkowbacteria bacterium]
MNYLSLKYKKGFSFVELMVVISIIAVLSTMAIISLNSSRVKSRDSKRVADVKQLSSALEMYYNRNGAYPTLVTSGEALKSPDGLITYMASVPSAPTPNDGNCSPEQNAFSYEQIGTSYVVSFCLGGKAGDLIGGMAYATPRGISNSNDTDCGVTIYYGGISYPTVKIGDQCWMKENLRIGYMIPVAYGQNNVVMPNIIDKYCVDNLAANCQEYGALYQWHTVMALPACCDDDTCEDGGIYHDCVDDVAEVHRGICPVGWHVPSESDFSILTFYLSINGQGGDGDGDDLGGKLKEAGLTHWLKESCDNGTDPIANCNSSGFNALPGGFYDSAGALQFFNDGVSTDNAAVFWSALTDGDDNTHAIARDMTSNDSAAYLTSYDKATGASVRCLKD